MNPPPRIAIVITRAAVDSGRARCDPVVHRLHVAHEVDDRRGPPLEELLALLGGRLARIAPDPAPLLEQRPEGAGRRQEDRVEERQRVVREPVELRHEVAHALHVAEGGVDCQHRGGLADGSRDARAPREVGLGLLGLEPLPVGERETRTPRGRSSNISAAAYCIAVVFT